MSATKFSLYSRHYRVEACNEWRDPSQRFSAKQHNLVPNKHRSGGNTVSDVTGWGFESQIYLTDPNQYAKRMVQKVN